MALVSVDERSKTPRSPGRSYHLPVQAIDIRTGETSVSHHQHRKTLARHHRCVDLLGFLVVIVNIVRLLLHVSQQLRFQASPASGLVCDHLEVRASSCLQQLHFACACSIHLSSPLSSLRLCFSFRNTLYFLRTLHRAIPSNRIGTGQNKPCSGSRGSCQELASRDR